VEKRHADIDSVDNRGVFVRIEPSNELQCRQHRELISPALSVQHPKVEKGEIRADTPQIVIAGYTGVVTESPIAG
jgi:hypothetical protein